MTELARHLIEDVRRGSLAALLILAGFCAALTPAAGPSQTRDALTRLGISRVAPSSIARSTERSAVAFEPSRQEQGDFLAPPPPHPVVERVAWGAPAPFHGEASAGLPSLASHLYRARAPPAV